MYKDVVREKAVLVSYLNPLLLLKKANEYYKYYGIQIIFAWELSSDS